MLILLILVCLSSIASSYLLWTWFDGAKFFVEWANLLGIGEILPPLRNYNSIVKQGSPLSFLEYLADYYDNFAVRLIACEKCLATWIGAASQLYVYFLSGHPYPAYLLPILSLVSAYVSILLYKHIKSA